MDTCLAMAAIQASGVGWEQIVRAGGFHVQLAEQKDWLQVAWVRKCPGPPRQTAVAGDRHRKSNGAFLKVTVLWPLQLIFASY